VRRGWLPNALAASCLAILLGALSATTPAAADPGTTTTPVAGQYTYPPAAPRPTSDANSPAVPDPNPPRGGIGPHGVAVGGKRLLSRGVVVPANTPALPGGLTARAWVLVDVDSGDVLAARDAHGRYQPASILKTLTSVTLIPLLRGDRVVTVSSAAATAEGSAAGLVAGGRYTVDDLFSGLLLVSGNDCAAALAQAAGGYAKTVQLMNSTALRLGAYDTYVQTPSGLDGWRQLTSAYDMAIFLRAALDQPRFLAYDRAPAHELPWQQINGFGPVRMSNQNEQFLTTVPGALAAKTGYTDAALHTFVGAISRHGHRLAVVFLRAQRWPTDQWQQATDLINWGLALPAGTAAVGHLDAAIGPPAPATAMLGPARAVSHPTADLGTRQHQTVRVWELIAIGALLAAVGALARRRARERQSTA
jgi:serine-type D-Ala-D-Ala carboxypeptidase (penicillin-binding protein 5/6)